MVLRYRAPNGKFVDFDLSESEEAPIRAQLAQKGFLYVARNPKTDVPKMTADELTAIFTPRELPDILGPQPNGSIGPCGKVGGGRAETFRMQVS